LAREGAAVVVNDLGGDITGAGSDLTPAQEVVKEIEALGGSAVVSGHDVADWQQAQGMVELAVESFGRLDILVNNAGILRDKTLANMSEDEWDQVVRVHLKGHAAPTRHAVAYWRAQSKAGKRVDASVVHTSSLSGLVGNFGQANYGAAKMGVIALSSVVNLECGSYGVRSNVIAPAAATRMGATVGTDSPEPGYSPDRISPLVVWLCLPDCPAVGQVFQIHGRRLYVLAVPTIAADFTAEGDGMWSLDALDMTLLDNLAPRLQVSDFLHVEDFT
jgi:NAD(P)-dependent dehydrogenase (short-subunit alcohol dehydrogenase family)